MELLESIFQCKNIKMLWRSRNNWAKRQILCLISTYSSIMRRSCTDEHMSNYNRFWLNWMDLLLLPFFCFYWLLSQCLKSTTLKISSPASTKLIYPAYTRQRKSTSKKSKKTRKKISKKKSKKSSKKSKSARIAVLLGNNHGRASLPVMSQT